MKILVLGLEKQDQLFMFRRVLMAKGIIPQRGECGALSHMTNLRRVLAQFEPDLVVMSWEGFGKEAADTITRELPECEIVVASLEFPEYLLDGQRVTKPNPMAVITAKRWKDIRRRALAPPPFRAPVRNFAAAS